MQRLVRTPPTVLRRSRRVAQQVQNSSNTIATVPVNMSSDDETKQKVCETGRESNSLNDIKEQLSALLGGLSVLRQDMAAERKARHELELRVVRAESASGQQVAPSTTTTASSATTADTIKVVPVPPVSAQPVLAQKLYPLPSFSGHCEQWPLFAAAYHQSTVAFGYTALQNLFRLQSSLQGAARETVQCLLIDPANVDDIIDTLKFRYGRPELIIRDQLDRIRLLPVLQERNIEQFVNMATRVRNTVALLNTDASRHVLGDTTLLAELVTKLPHSKKEAWAEYASTIQPRATAMHFSKWMSERARCLASLDSSTTSATTPASSSRPVKPKTVTAERHILHSVQQPTSESTKTTCKGWLCGICTGSHRVIACPRFVRMSVADRWAAARRLRLCFGCLRSSHCFRDCRSKQQCQRDGCTYWHHDSLHNLDKQQQPSKPNTLETTHVPKSTASNHTDSNKLGQILNCCDSPGNSPILFRVVPVILHGPKGQVDTYALIDEGSSFTAIDAALAEQLGLRGPASTLNMQFIGHNGAVEHSEEVRFDISGSQEPQRRFTIQRARTVRNLNLPVQSLSVTTAEHSFLRGIPVRDYQNAKPKLLIGLDHCQLGVGTVTRVSEDGGLVAAKTPLGWIVYGSLNTHSKVAASYHCYHTSEHADLDHLVREYYSTESFGVKGSSVELESDDNIRARSIMGATTQRVGLRFQTGLLWRSDNINLPDSRDMALRRLESLHRKLRRDPECSRLYENQIESYVRKGYASKLNKEEASKHDERTWYLPHFAVRSASKPEKLRLVFDAAASVDDTSLNSALLKGPDLNQPLIKILHRFRTGRVAVSADIAEMFHQVEIQPTDRKSQRFLWKSCHQTGPPDTYEMSVMTFGACCSPTSAQYVKNMNAIQHELDFPEASKAIQDDHYVDDYVASFPTSEQALRTTREVVKVHKRGGFLLRGFVSNCPVVSKGLNGARNETIDMEFSGVSGEKILGLRWDTQHDQFIFMLRFNKVPSDVVSGDRFPTKREVLSATMSIFDPFGFLANFTIGSKLLIQALWRTGVTWDEYIPAKLASKWLAWFREVSNIRTFNVPRCYSLHFLSGGKVQLHIFADASESAFAAVAYWRVEYAGERTLSFIIGKSRCAPIKQLTVPRLELQAAVLATRLYTHILDCHDIKIDRLFMWTDSRIVLHWIKSTERRFKIFVSHRVGEILDATEAAAWNWVPTHLNVADDATRGCDQPKFDSDCRWIRGPEFLLRDESEWPIFSCTDVDDSDQITKQTDEECVRFAGFMTHEQLVDFHRFSSFTRLRRTAALVLRFIQNVRAHRKDRRIGVLTVSELNAGTRLLCRIAQKQHYPSEYTALANGDKPERSSSVHKLRPYMDGDNLIRLYGRTDLADTKYLPATAKRPILLGRHHQLSQLIVKHFHEKMGHQLEGTVICAVRQQFWIPHLRVLVRHVKSKCQYCKNREVRPQPLLEGQLPVDRLTPFEFPFKYTGLDYFGPVQVAVGRQREKRWIALFTCLTTRAIHMEVAEDLSTDACLMVIKNFANIRGTPARIRSDCGTNFVGADGEIRRTSDFFDMSAIQRDLATNGIEWLFNCPANPEAGGSWERLVQSTKRILANTLKEVAPRIETLRSLIIEAANILNSRPLTDIPVSPNELEPLTPNHFLLGRANSTTTVGPEEPRQLSNRRQWVVCQQLVRTFWRRWIREYLPVLTRRTKEYADVQPIREGDLVLICDGNQPRGTWLRGRVERTITGTDGIARLAEVFTSKGKLRRPMSKLARLDVVSETESHGVRDVGERNNKI